MNNSTLDVITSRESTSRHSVAGDEILTSSFPLNRDKKPKPNYLRSSSHSCHEFCKYGRKNGWENDVKHHFLHKGKSLASHEMQRQANNLNLEQKTKRLAMKLRSLSGQSIHFSDSTKAIKHKTSSSKLVGMPLKHAESKLQIASVDEKFKTKNKDNIQSLSKKEELKLKQINWIIEKNDSSKQELSSTLEEHKNLSARNADMHHKPNGTENQVHSPLKNEIKDGKKVLIKSYTSPAKIRSCNRRSVTVSRNNDSFVNSTIISKSSKMEILRSRSSLPQSIYDRRINEEKTNKEKILYVIDMKHSLDLNPQHASTQTKVVHSDDKLEEFPMPTNLCDSSTEVKICNSGNLIADYLEKKTLIVEEVSLNDPLNSKPGEGQPLYMVSNNDEHSPCIVNPSLYSVFCCACIVSTEVLLDEDQLLHLTSCDDALHSISPHSHKLPHSISDNEIETEVETKNSEESEIDSYNESTENESGENLQDGKNTRGVLNDSTPTKISEQVSELKGTERNNILNPQESNTTSNKLTFRRGKVIDFQTESISLKKLTFCIVRAVTNCPVEVEPNSDARRNQLKHQDVQKKKDSVGLFNSMVEETANKLVAIRKSKVKALVDAFETMISHHTQLKHSL